MKYIDMHCDTLMHFLNNKNHSLYKNDLQVDFLKMQNGNTLAQFFAVFFPPVLEFEKMGIEISDKDYFKKLTDGLFNELEKHKSIISIAKNYDDIINNDLNKKMSAVLTIEDARFFNGKLENIKTAYDVGVRAVGLTWNAENCLGYPNHIETRTNPLKPFGIEAIEYMNNLGMLIDVSHLSDGGFYDVAKYSKKPFVATHSNARKISNNQRNLTDDMLKILGETGSVTGLNFCPKFIEKSQSATHTTIEGIINHAKHIVNKAGIDALGIGTDFDGIYGTQEISSAQDMPLLFESFKKAGFAQSEIEKIASKNVLRVIRDSVK